MAAPVTIPPLTTPPPAPAPAVLPAPAAAVLPPYDPVHFPWPAVLPNQTTPHLRQAQIGRLTSVLMHLTDGNDYPPFSFLPDTLMAFSSREERLQTGIWAYVHKIDVVPRMDEVINLALPAPEIKFPERISRDLIRPWVSVTDSPVRNALVNDDDPRYRLLIFIHRFLYPGVDTSYNSPYETFGFTVWDRENDSVDFYDFMEAERVGRQLAIWSYWSRVQISYTGVPGVPTPLYPMLARGFNTVGGHFDSLSVILSRMRAKRIPPRVTLYATIGAVLDLMNQIDNPGVLIPEDSEDCLSGLRMDLIPMLFDEVLDILRQQPINLAAIPPQTIQFTRPLPFGMHLAGHGGQPFLDRNWISMGLRIPDYQVNRLIRNRLRTRLRMRVLNGNMPGWYPFEMITRA